MTLPWFLVALALQIDLQAFIKAASGYAGKKLLDNQLHMCVRLNTSMFVGLCYFMWLCVCVCLRLGPRLLPEVEFHSLLFHYSYKATAPLHRVQSCKNFFPLLSSLLGPPFLFFLFYGYSWNGTKHLCKLIFFFSILGFKAEAELNLSHFKHLLHKPIFLQVEIAFKLLV